MKSATGHVFIAPAASKLRFGCAIEALLALPVGLLHQRACRFALSGCARSALSNGRLALLRSSGSNFVQQDRVVVHTVDICHPLSTCGAADRWAQAGRGMRQYWYEYDAERLHRAQWQRHVQSSSCHLQTRWRGRINPLFEVNAMPDFLTLRFHARRYGLR